jgi:hypothetical protein
MVINKRVLLLLTLFFIILLSKGCAKKADVCDEAIRIVCKSEYKDERMCNETKKFAEAARQKESLSAKAYGIEWCSKIVNTYNIGIDLKKGEKYWRK